MIIISYDISNNKVRSKFARYLKRFGFKIQFSVYQIDNGEAFLDNIVEEINNTWKRSFSERDSVIVLQLSKTCKINYYGYAEHQEKELLFI